MQAHQLGAALIEAADEFETITHSRINKLSTGHSANHPPITGAVSLPSLTWLVSHL